MIDRHGQRLDDAGKSASQKARARPVLMLTLNAFERGRQIRAKAIGECLPLTA